MAGLPPAHPLFFSLHRRQSLPRQRDPAKEKEHQMSHLIPRNVFRTMILIGALATAAGLSAHAENPGPRALEVHTQASHPDTPQGTEEDHGWQ
jgi:hypothetical protein